MAAIRPRDLLTEACSVRLGQAGGPAGDIAALARGRLPERRACRRSSCGLGCPLSAGRLRPASARTVHAPDTALAVSAHLYWTGAAADAFRRATTLCGGSWLRPRAARLSRAGTVRRAVTSGSRTRVTVRALGEGGYRFRDPDVLSTKTPAGTGIAGARRARGRACRAAAVGPRVRRARHPMYARVPCRQGLGGGYPSGGLHDKRAHLGTLDSRQSCSVLRLARARSTTRSPRAPRRRRRPPSRPRWACRPASAAGEAGLASAADEADEASAVDEPGAADEPPAGSAGRPALSVRTGRWPVRRGGHPAR